MDILEDIPQSSRIGKHPTFSQRPKTKMLDEGTDVELERRLVAEREPHTHKIFCLLNIYLISLPPLSIVKYRFLISSHYT